VFAGGFWAPYATYVFISLLYASVAACLVSFVEPLAAGSGIPEIKTYLNGIHIKGLLAVRLHSLLSLPKSAMRRHITLETLLHDWMQTSLALDTSGACPAAIVSPTRTCGIRMH